MEAKENGKGVVVDYRWALDYRIRCRHCGEVFNLTNEQQSDEWYYEHDDRCVEKLMM